MKQTINERKEEVIKSFPKFDNFWVDALDPHSNSTKTTQFSILYKFFKVINKFDPSMFTEDDIRTLKKHEDFKKLSNISKNMYLIIIKKYLKYYNREDLVEIMKKTTKYPVKKHELNKNELVSRDELKQILSILDTKKKAMIMVLYEGALRRKELVSIRFKDVEFTKGLINLYVTVSKIVRRNIPLKDSIMYLKDYFSMNEFEPDDLIFNYSTSSITVIINRIEEKLKKKYPNWTKSLNPHLFRHSRLTEMAPVISESVLRKYAGWVGESKMTGVYVHLDDSDVENSVYGVGQAKKQVIEQIEPTICPHCHVKNPPETILCYKCGNIINKDRIVEGRLIQMEKIEKIDELVEENKELKNELVAMKSLYKEETNKLWNQMKEMRDDMTSMFQDRDYNKAFREAGVSELTEDEKHSKPKSK